MHFSACEGGSSYRGVALMDQVLISIKGICKARMLDFMRCV